MDPQIYILLILLLFFAGFAAIELAFFSLPLAKVRALVNANVKHARLLLKLKNNSQKVLITILIVLFLINTSLAAIAAILATKQFGSIGTGIAIGIMTILLLFFGEIIPKSIAQRHTDAIALRTAPLLRVIMVMFWPIITLMNWLASGTHRLLHVERTSSAVSEEDVRAMVLIGQEEGSLEADEREMIEKVFQLNDITADDVMTPDEYIIGFDANTTLADALPIIQQTGHSRFPVFRASGDVAGILYIKDVFRCLAQYTLSESNEMDEKVLEAEVSTLMQPALFVPETKQADDLLREFQTKHKHIAIVVDEHGTAQGLVTLEDLLEEIVGDIADETDSDNERMIEHINDDSYEIDPRVSIDQINRTCGTSLKAPRHKSIGWLVLKTFRRIPEKGDAVTIDHYNFIIQEADDRRIKRLLMVRTAKAKRHKQIEEMLDVS